MNSEKPSVMYKPFFLQHGQKELPKNQTANSIVVQNLSGWQAPVKGTKARP